MIKIFPLPSHQHLNCVATHVSTFNAYNIQSFPPCKFNGSLCFILFSLYATFDVNERKNCSIKIRWDCLIHFHHFRIVFTVFVVVEGGLCAKYMLVDGIFGVGCSWRTRKHITYMNKILKSCVFCLIREKLVKKECGSTSRGELREFSQNIFHLPCIMYHRREKWWCILFVLLLW